MRSNVETHELSNQLFVDGNVAEWCDLFSVEESTYIDPLFGEYRGRSAIKQWLVEVMGRAHWRSTAVGPRYFDGSTAAGEAQLLLQVRGGELALPFAFVQRYEEGSIVYRRDYYDTYELRQRVGAEYLVEPGTER